MEITRQPPDWKESFYGISAFILSAAALYWGTGLRPVWWLTWWAPLPILLVAPRLSGVWISIVSFAAWTLGGTNMWNYFHQRIEIPWMVILLITATPALVFCLATLAYRRALRSSAWLPVIVFPSIWVGYEFVSERLSPHGTFGNISYSQMNFLHVIQLASITGIYGISFCLFLFPATLRVLLRTRTHLRVKLRMGAVVGLVFASVLGFGAWRLHSVNVEYPVVQVGLIASDLRKNILPEKPNDALRLIEEYGQELPGLADRGAQVIVMPEKTAVVRDSDIPEMNSVFQMTATKRGRKVLVGILHPTVSAKWNEARLYSPAHPIQTYAKHHMVPSFESDLTVGTTRTSWVEPSGRWGIAICKDMDFPLLSRQYGQDGTGLLLVPAWDFEADAWLHSRMAILRGVESGFSIARAAKQGVLTASDDTGRILMEGRSNAALFSGVVASVPVHHTRTIYALFGDWLGWLNLCVLGLLLARMFLKRSNSTQSA